MLLISLSTRTSSTLILTSSCPEYQRTTNILPLHFPHKCSTATVSTSNKSHQPTTHCTPATMCPLPDTRHLGQPELSELASQCSVTKDIATLHSTNTADMESLANQLIEQLSMASTWSISSTQIAPSNLPHHHLARPCPALQQTPPSSRLVSRTRANRFFFFLITRPPTCKRLLHVSLALAMGSRRQGGSISLRSQQRLGAKYRMRSSSSGANGVEQAAQPHAPASSTRR